MNISSVIKKPLLTEKASFAKEKHGKYTFMVDSRANKFQIREAVESLFNVKVICVCTANYLGKKKRVGRSEGYKNNWKKAVVKIASGQEIQIMEEV
ncbi:MAG: 50S ribosomal protein L23 [Elusimicrobiota bacterium]|jgi:large subunit ribosomal protein L23|nr:50S ribosomal protein L23 [Elusimicrobiota bacterium]